MAPVDRPATETDAIVWLVAEVPELRPLLDEHLEDYDGELLRHVVLESDFLRWLIERVRAGDTEPARRFLAAIEPLLTTDVNPAAK